MPKTELKLLPSALLLTLTLLASGCATREVAVAVSCPEPPKPPARLTRPVSATDETPLETQLNDLLLEFRKSLTEATITD